MFRSGFRDFHILVYLCAQTEVPLTEDVMKPLLEAMRDQRLEEVYRWTEEHQWKTLELIMNNIADGFQ